MLTSFFRPSGLFDWMENTAPYAQVRESEKATMLEMEVPRYHMDEIRIDADVKNGILTVSGHRPRERYNVDEEQLMWSTAPLGDFRRSFSFSPNWYDLSKYETNLDAGVLMITVPKREAPPAHQPLRIFGGGKEGQLVTTTTPEEFRAVRRARWPPMIHRDETASELTYRCELPPTVSKDHIKLDLNGRALSLSIMYQYTVQTEYREEAQSLSYSTTLTVPQGTKPADISTSYENGIMTISLSKHQSVPVIEGRQGEGRQRPDAPKK